MSVNKVLLVGRLGSDPETKQTDKSSLTKFNLATSESYLKDGERVQNTEWHRVLAWGKTGEICSKFLTKGSQVYLEGKLQTRSWEGDDGVKRYTTEIVANNVQFLGSKRDQGQAPAYDSNAPSLDDNEELPF